MNIRKGLLFLLFQVFAWSSDAQKAPLEIDQQVVKHLDQVYPPLDPGCRLLRVLSQDNTNVWQHGIAWNLGEFQNKNQFVTPAHVIWDAKNIKLMCQDKVIPAKVVKASLAYDLALLESSERIAEFEKLSIFSKDRFTWNGSEAFEKAQVLAETDKIVVPWDKGYRVLYNFLSKDPLWNADLSHIGYPYVYRTQRVSIAQGMSGSPVLGSNTTYGPLGKKTSDFILQGMITKTYLNGSQSFVLPTPFILKTLDLLRRDVDPFTQDHPDLKFEKLRSSKGPIVTRITHLPTGKFIEQTCSGTSWGDSSGAWGDGSGAWGDGSGAWGDGNGKMNEKEADFKFLLKNLTFSALSGNELGGFTISNLNQSACTQSIFRNSDGKVLSFLKKENKIEKPAFLAELFLKGSVTQNSFENLFHNFLPGQTMQKAVMSEFCQNFQRKFGASATFIGNIRTHFHTAFSDQRVIAEQKIDLTTPLRPNEKIPSDYPRALLSCSQDEAHIEIWVEGKKLFKVDIKNSQDLQGTLFGEEENVALHGKLEAYSFQQALPQGIQFKLELGLGEFAMPIYMELLFREKQDVIHKMSIYMGHP